MAQSGDLGFVLDDTEPAALSVKETDRLYNAVMRASVENRIIEARRTLSNDKLPFGRHLQWIRNKSSTSREDIALSLEKDVSFIDKIEDGRASPLDLLRSEIADIMQLFRIGIKEFSRTVEAYLELSMAKTGKMSSMARSSLGTKTDSKEEALSHAFDAVLLKIAEKEKPVQQGPGIDEEYIREIRNELKKRGELELLE